MLTRRLLLVVVLILLAAVGSANVAQAGKPTSPPPSTPTPPPNPEILYYTVEGKGKTLRQGTWKMNADGTNKTFVWPDADNPTWSPDGTQIVLNWFQAPEPLGYGNIFRIDADGTDPLLLDPYGAGRATWSPAPPGSPTHNLVAYMGENDPVDGSNDNSLMMVDASGGTPVRLIQGRPSSYDGCSYAYPEWSRDGQVLVVVALCGADYWPGFRALLVVPPFAPEERYVLLNLEELGGLYALWPSWARQHDWLVFGASLGGVSGTYRLDLTVDEAGRYTVFSGPNLVATDMKHAVWSPDDSKLAFNATGGSYIQDLATGVRTLIGPGGISDWKR